MTKSEFMARLGAALSQMSEQERNDILNDYEEHFRIGAEQGKTEESISYALGSPEELAASYTDGETEQVGTSHPEQTQEYAQPDFHETPNQQPPVQDYSQNGWQTGGYYTQEPGKDPEFTQQPQSSQSSQPPFYGQGYVPNQPYYQQAAQPTYVYAQRPSYQSRTAGERAAYLILMICLTLFLVLPVGGGIAIGLWFAILGIGIAAGAVSIAMLVASSAGVGFVLLGIAFACLCAALVFGLIGYTGGVVKLFSSYFKMCSRLINGRGVA